MRTIPTLISGGEQNLLYINEPNLYKVIFQSRKESGRTFYRLGSRRGSSINPQAWQLQQAYDHRKKAVCIFGIGTGTVFKMGESKYC